MLTYLYQFFFTLCMQLFHHYPVKISWQLLKVSSIPSCLVLPRLVVPLPSLNLFFLQLLLYKSQVTLLLPFFPLERWPLAVVSCFLPRVSVIVSSFKEGRPSKEKTKFQNIWLPFLKIEILTHGEVEQILVYFTPLKILSRSRVYCFASNLKTKFAGL